MLSEQQQRIMGYFIEEAKDHLNTIEQGLLSLQTTIEDPELVSEVFRAAHSVKGGAAMLGLNSIQMTSHRLEDYFKILKECPIQVDQTIENLFLSVFDALKEQLDQLQGPFGLTDDKAAEIMAEVEPVFGSLGQHLSELVAASGGVAPDDVELPTTPWTVPVTAPPAAATVAQEESSALQLIFQSDIPVRLRDMLQLFKQRDDFDSRGQLQEVCQDMAQLGEPFELSEWTTLLTLAAQAIANPDNTYRTLAPILIKEVKQAQELVLSGQSTSIVPSEALLTLLPEEAVESADDLADLLASGSFDELDAVSLDDYNLAEPLTSQDMGMEEMFAESPLLDELDQLSLSNAFAQENNIDYSSSELEFTDIYTTDESTAEAFTEASTAEFEAALNGQNELLFSTDLENSSEPNATTERHGPEVGMAELNSLADLFEGEMPDLGTTWQEEAVIGLNPDGQIDFSELESASDFSDLLFENHGLEELALEDAEDDDLSGLLISAEQLAAAAPTPVETFDASFDLGLDEPLGVDPNDDLNLENTDDFELPNNLFSSSDLDNLLPSDASDALDSSPSPELDGFEQLFAGLGESSFAEDSANLPNDLFFFDAEVIDSDTTSETESAFEELLASDTESLTGSSNELGLGDADLLEALGDEDPSPQPLNLTLDELSSEDEALISGLYAMQEDEPLENPETISDPALDFSLVPDPWGANGQISEDVLPTQGSTPFVDLDEATDLWQEPNLEEEAIAADELLSSNLSVEELADLAVEGLPSSIEQNQESAEFDFGLFDSDFTNTEPSASTDLDTVAELTSLDELHEESAEFDFGLFDSDFTNTEPSASTDLNTAEELTSPDELYEESAEFDFGLFDSDFTNTEPSASTDLDTAAELTSLDELHEESAEFDFGLFDSDFTNTESSAAATNLDTAEELTFPDELHEESAEFDFGLFGSDLADTELFEPSADVTPTDELPPLSEPTEESEAAFNFSLFDSDISTPDALSSSLDLEPEESVLDELFREEPAQEDSVFLSEVLNLDEALDTETNLNNLFDSDSNLFEEPGDFSSSTEAAQAEPIELDIPFSEATTDDFEQTQDWAVSDLVASDLDDEEFIEPLSDLESVDTVAPDSLPELEIEAAVLEVEELGFDDLSAPDLEPVTPDTTSDADLAFTPFESEISNSLLDFTVEEDETNIELDTSLDPVGFTPFESEVSDPRIDFTIEEDETNIELDTSLDSIGFTDWLTQDSLDDLTDEEDAFDLSEAIAASEEPVIESTETQNWAELETLMAEPFDSLSNSDSATSEVADVNSDFSNLDTLLEEPALTETASFDDFADLDALLEQPAAVTTPPQPPSAPSAADDFDDLEKLLEDADKTLGGAPSGRSNALSNARRPSRRSATALSDQTMRVSVKNLDNLNNLVGELVVNRNSLEQAEDRLRQFLDNLLYQVQQLSDVGQRMRDLYERSLLESSLLSNRRSYQLTSQPDVNPTPANHATGLSFDALEMDRFTGFHTLSQEMIELIVRVRESSSDIDFVVDETDQITRNFRQITTQLQEGLTRSRMVPFTQAADRLPRAVRDISVKCGKQAELIIEGRDTLIDKMILEQLYDPMTHLVNNAITHGIETPQERQAAGKPAMGKITVRTFHQGNQTVISVMDDGAGIDPERVKTKAIEKGLITSQEAQEMSRLDVYDLLFHHGFSTRDKADDFAGRGVGMDVVRTSLNEIRGVVNIDSAVGRGTTFTIRLPLTLSISKALCCISNRARIAFPMDGVEDMLDIPRDRIQRDEQDRPCIQWRDTLLPFSPLSDLLRYNRNLGRGSVYGGNQEDDIISVVVLRSAGNFLALQIDQVLGEQEIVIKQLEGPVPKPMGVAGATVLGDGRIMPIADVLELIDLSMGRIRREAGNALWEKDDAQGPAEPIDLKHEPTVLIVDDSITVRELLSMTFNKVGYRVEQARDGQEAWEKLRSGLPCDLVFCDIEMPRMDGLELLSRIQKDPSLEHLPIAMLTSRGADRHRQMAVQLGAKGYFTKPYLEEALLDAAQRMLNGEVLVNTSV